MTIHRQTFLAAFTALALGAGALETRASEKAPRAEAVESDQLAKLGEQMATLANEVNLPAWAQIAASPDFTSIEENWVAVYSPKDAVGSAQDWNAQLKTARSLTGTAQPAQKRWLSLFIKAGEAVARKDSRQFVTAVRALQNEAVTSRTVLAANQNFFTAK